MCITYKFDYDLDIVYINEKMNIKFIYNLKKIISYNDNEILTC